ncbi:putative reverse transcriptase domain-containing protein [Tanacetum coccineum]
MVGIKTVMLSMTTFNAVAIVYTRWIKKMESVQDMSGCRDSQKMKYTAGSFVGKALTWWNSQIHTRGREATIGMAAMLRKLISFHELSSLGHFAKDCRVVPRNVESDSQTRGNHQHQVVAVNGGQGYRNQGNQARGRAFMLGVEEARQDPNIVTGTFTLNDHYATTLFDSGADYSFVSNTFIPLLGIEPSDLSFNYEIKIASRQLVEIDKVIKGCKLEIEGHMFDINLIPFGSGSFDVIIGTDWLSDHKAEIIYNEKVVRIPLLYGKVFRVLGEKPEANVRQLRVLGTMEHKKEEIVVVRDFLESPYRLAPSELENFRTKVSFDQAYRLGEHRYGIQFLGHVINGDDIHVDPSKIEANWKAPRTPSKGEEKENAFQTEKDKLCNAPVLALSNGLEDFVVYCDASGLGLGCMLIQKELNMRQRPLEELFSDYDCEICYHLGKANVVADDRILAAQKEASDESAGLQKGLDKMIELRNDRALYYLDRIWVPLKGGVRTLIVDEAHKSKLRLSIRRHLACCSNLKPPNEMEEALDLVTKLYLNEIVASHSVPISIIYDHDSRFMSRFWQSMQEALGTRLDIKLPEELRNVHNTFHVSNLKKCLSDESLIIPMKELRLDDKLNFVEEPVEIIDREVKQLRQSRIPIVKVRWNSKRGP